MNGSVQVRIAGLLIGVAAFSSANAFDILRAERAVSSTPGGDIVSLPASCEFGELGSPLQLQEAVERALCTNPKTREAWATVKVQAAAVGIARAAYLPTLTADWQGVRDDSVTNVANHPDLSSASVSTVRTENVSLNWVLYDFGARRAALNNATALFMASKATQNATLQTAFISVTKDYYSAQAALGALDAANEVQTMTDSSLQAAQARVDGGIAPISDALQAMSAREQAVLNAVKARGALQLALGTLANDMDLPESTPLALPPLSSGVQPDAIFSESIAALIDSVRQAHPTVLAAQEQLDAAIAKVAQTRAKGLPSLSLVSKYSRNNQPASLGLGVPPYPSTGHEWYVGFQLTIPIFDGFGHMYQVHQDDAQVEVQRDMLNEVQQQAGLDVWTAYQALRTSTDTLKSDAVLLDVAHRSFSASEHRYREGVGSILELLNVQTTLARAEQEHIQAVSEWRAARLRLAGSLGRLSVDDVREQ